MGSYAWLLILYAEYLVVVLAVESCPPTVKCITSENRESCKARGLSFQKNVLFNNCCPGCVKKAIKDEPCEIDDDCATGLTCNVKKKVCAEKTKGCEKTFRDAATAHRVWIPDCLPDDTFAPKQCKGELMSGRCFCFDPNGIRIYGEEVWNKAENMTCACSRLMWETLQVRPDASYHCNSQGNFEELQCDDGVCWCAREDNGEPFSAIVPEKMMKALPCYNIDTHGNQYLRNCDSQRVAQTRAKQLLSIHGTDNINFPSVACNYDGSFARVQIRDNQQFCTSRDGRTVSDYPTGMLYPTDCNCAYDKFITDGNFDKVCDQAGRYQTQQSPNDKSYCVDEDGFYKDCK